MSSSSSSSLHPSPSPSAVATPGATTITMVDPYFPHHLSLEETFGLLVHLFARKWTLFLSLSTLATILIAIVTTVNVYYIIPPFLDALPDQVASNYYTHWLLTRGLFYAPVYYGIMCVADGAIIRAVAELYIYQQQEQLELDHHQRRDEQHQNELANTTPDDAQQLSSLSTQPTRKQQLPLPPPASPPKVLHCLLCGLAKLGHLLGATFLVAISVMVPSVAIFWCLVVLAHVPESALLVLGLLWVCGVVWIIVALYPLYPIIMVEQQPPQQQRSNRHHHGNRKGRNIIASILRALQFSKGFRVYIFSTLLLFHVSQYFCTSVAHVMAGDYTHRGAILVSQTLAWIVTIYFASLGSVLQAIIYLNIRVEKEALNANILQAELTGVQAAAASLACCACGGDDRYMAQEESTAPYMAAMDNKEEEEAGFGKTRRPQQQQQHEHPPPDYEKLSDSFMHL